MIVIGGCQNNLMEGAFLQNSYPTQKYISRFVVIFAELFF